MSYLAIARKHRPKTFEEMAGQSHVTRTLKNAILRDRIHHAYLFSGPRGVGKTTTSCAFAIRLADLGLRTLLVSSSLRDGAHFAHGQAWRRSSYETVYSEPSS